jgi:hypothetical protein
MSSVTEVYFFFKYLKLITFYHCLKSSFIFQLANSRFTNSLFAFTPCAYECYCKGFGRYNCDLERNKERKAYSFRIHQTYLTYIRLY